jgi:hypothetical protein
MRVLCLGEGVHYKGWMYRDITKYVNHRILAHIIPAVYEIRHGLIKSQNFICVLYLNMYFKPCMVKTYYFISVHRKLLKNDQIN